MPFLGKSGCCPYCPAHGFNLYCNEPGRLGLDKHLETVHKIRPVSNSNLPTTWSDWSVEMVIDFISQYNDEVLWRYANKAFGLDSSIAFVGTP